MPVDVKAILSAAEPEPVFGEDVMALSRIAQSNRTYKRAQQLREKQEYDTFAIAQGAEVAGSVNFMDSLADIDLSIAEIAKMSAAHKGNNLVQASLTKLRGGLEETKELAAGRNLAVESLSNLKDEIYQMHQKRADKSGVYNEVAVTDLINKSENFMYSNAHYFNAALRKDYESEIDDLVKTRNVYNMIDFYDIKDEEEEIQFQTNVNQPNYLTGIQRGLLQQAKNFADVGNVDNALLSINKLAEVGVSEAKYTKKLSGISTARQELENYGSSIEAINTEVDKMLKITGVGIDEKDEPIMHRNFKKAVSGFKIELPTARKLAGPGGLDILNTNIESSSELLGTTLDLASGHGLWNPDALENITITSQEAGYLGLDEGSTLQDVLDAYKRRAVMEEKEPYMDILATYAADPENLKTIAKGFKGEPLDLTFDEKEKNAARFLSGAARTYIKLKTLRQKHFYDIPVSELYNYMDVQGLQSTQFNW
jgi:hypothetical protein